MTSTLGNIAGRLSPQAQLVALNCPTFVGHGLHMRRAINRAELMASHLTSPTPGGQQRPRTNVVSLEVNCVPPTPQTAPAMRLNAHTPLPSAPHDANQEMEEWVAANVGHPSRDQDRGPAVPQGSRPSGAASSMDVYAPRGTSQGPPQTAYTSTAPILHSQGPKRRALSCMHAAAPRRRHVPAPFKLAPRNDPPLATMAASPAARLHADRDGLRATPDGGRLQGSMHRILHPPGARRSSQDFIDTRPKLRGLNKERGVHQTPTPLMKPKRKEYSAWLQHHGSCLSPPPRLAPQATHEKQAASLADALARMGILEASESGNFTNALTSKGPPAVARRQRMERLREAQHRVLFQHAPEPLQTQSGPGRINIACIRERDNRNLTRFGGGR